jgi:mRNA-degrading endonuclease RelE of RelBE toxin-antitoxin system
VKILLAERFQREIGKLSKVQRARCLELLLSIPKGISQPHDHSGLGIRKLHRSGIYEARVGLGLRLVFTVRDDQVILVTVGTHDQVKKYLASL